MWLELLCCQWLSKTCLIVKVFTQDELLVSKCFFISSSAGELASGRPVLAGWRVFACQPLCHHFFPHKPDTRRTDQTLTFYSSSQQSTYIFELDWTAGIFGKRSRTTFIKPSCFWQCVYLRWGIYYLYSYWIFWFCICGESGGHIRAWPK